MVCLDLRVEVAIEEMETVDVHVERGECVAMYVTSIDTCPAGRLPPPCRREHRR